MSTGGFTEPDRFALEVFERLGLSFPLFGDALEKVRAGITTFSEVRRTVPYRILMEP